MRKEKNNVQISQIKDYILEHKNDILEDLKTLISFQTIREKPEEIHMCLNWFLQSAENMGFTVKRTTGNDSGIVELGQGEETVGILVHLDVVDIGDPDKWTYPPFEGILSEGYLWGRGTMDDKGAAMICLYAMKALKELGVPFHKKIRLIVGTSEEDEWTDIENYKKEFSCPDYGFSPDGDFPIYNIENGYADIVLEFNEENHIKNCGSFHVESGKNTNMIPSKAVLDLNDIIREFHGTSAHSSSPELGVNAIEKLCASDLLTCGSKEACYDFHFARFINEVLGGDFHGGKLGLKRADSLWEGQAMGETIVVPTVLRQKNETVQLSVNLRQIPGISREDVENAFERFRSQYHYTYQIKEYLDPMRVNPKQKPFEIMAETYEDWGQPNRFLATAGSSYAKAMDNFVSWGPCFPGEESCAHQENERIRIDSLFLAMGIYTDYLYRIVSEKDNLL